MRAAHKPVTYYTGSKSHNAVGEGGLSDRGATLQFGKDVALPVPRAHVVVFLQLILIFASTSCSNVWQHYSNLCSRTFVDGHVVDTNHLYAEYTLKLQPFYQLQWIQRSVRYLNQIKNRFFNFKSFREYSNIRT